MPAVNFSTPGEMVPEGVAVLVYCTEIFPSVFNTLAEFNARTKMEIAPVLSSTTKVFPLAIERLATSLELAEPPPVALVNGLFWELLVPHPASMRNEKKSMNTYDNFLCNNMLYSTLIVRSFVIFND